MEIPIALFGFVLALIGTIVVWVRNSKFPRVTFLRMAAILVISFSVLGFFLFQSGRRYPSPPSPNQVSETDVSGLTTAISWPTSVVKNQSFSLEVLITPTSALTASTTTEPNQTQGRSQLTPVGTPHVPIAKAFGPQYDAFANAELSASAFDIAPQQQAKQSLDQKYVLFNWTLTPKYTQNQTLNVAVTGVWMPKSGGEPIERPLAGKLLHISVSDASLSLVSGQLTLSDLIVALMSSVLNIPWIVELFKKRQETKKEKSENSSSVTPSRTEKERQKPNLPSGIKHTQSGRQKKKK